MIYISFYVCILYILYPWYINVCCGLFGGIRFRAKWCVRLCLYMFIFRLILVLVCFRYYMSRSRLCLWKRCVSGVYAIWWGKWERERERTRNSRALFYSVFVWCSNEYVLFHSFFFSCVCVAWININIRISNPFVYIVYMLAFLFSMK